MGVSGHMLGSRRLRWLERKLEWPEGRIDRAFHFHTADPYEVVVRSAGVCSHYNVDPADWSVRHLPAGCRYSSCLDYAREHNKEG